MPRILIPILALACLVLGGCEKKQELEPEVTVTTVEPITYGSMDELTEVLHQPLPCPPETVYAMPPGRWVKVDRWHVFKSFFPDSAYHHNGEFRFSDDRIFPCPDSVFVLLKKE